MPTHRPLAAVGILMALVVSMVAAAGAAPALPDVAASAAGGHPANMSHDHDDDDDDDDDGDDDDGWKDGRLVLLTSQLPSLLPGQTGWVGLTWTATSNVCDVQVKASAPGMTITYPENTGPFSSFYVRNALAETNRDFTALKISVAAGAAAPVNVTLQATYTRLPPGKIKKSDDLKYKSVDCRGGRTGGATTATARLPIGAPSGPKATLKTTAVTIPAGTPTWVDLGFSTTYAGLDNFRVTLAPPTGLEVVYPGDRTSSGLANGAALPVGGTDAAAVRLGASGLGAGTYQVPVRATWTGGSVDTNLSLTVK